MTGKLFQGISFVEVSTAERGRLARGVLLGGKGGSERVLFDEYIPPTLSGESIFSMAGVTRIISQEGFQRTLIRASEEDGKILIFVSTRGLDVKGRSGFIRIADGLPDFVGKGFGWCGEPKNLKYGVREMHPIGRWEEALVVLSFGDALLVAAEEGFVYRISYERGEVQIKKESEIPHQVPA
ncbi:MAG: hypothetical protein HYV45_00300 [Candidatus Moranbacteria bacterium]|nr:hypothetical protein [Candidatus Moranbacteria bacterium]